MNFIRFLVISLFLGLAGWALYLDFLYGETAWVGANSDLGKFFASTLITLGPELAGIVIGVVIIDYLNERRQDAQLLQQLILQMGSSHNDVTDTAVRTLRSYGWLTDGSLKGAYLRGANLQGTYLRGANLQDAYLRGANLQDADLWEAILKEADLGGANLQETDLRGANLQDADLKVANLQEADLREANLQGADLWRANLQGTDLGAANLQEADLGVANLQGANLWRANLQRITNYTIEQLLQVKTLKRAIMLDGSKFEDWILRIPEDEIDPRAGAEIDRLMREFESEEEE